MLQPNEIDTEMEPGDGGDEVGLTVFLDVVGQYLRAILGRRAI